MSEPCPHCPLEAAVLPSQLLAAATGLMPPEKPGPGRPCPCHEHGRCCCGRGGPGARRRWGPHPISSGAFPDPHTGALCLQRPLGLRAGPVGLAMVNRRPAARPKGPLPTSCREPGQAQVGDCSFITTSVKDDHPPPPARPAPDKSPALITSTQAVSGSTSCPRAQAGAGWPSVSGTRGRPLAAALPSTLASTPLAPGSWPW